MLTEASPIEIRKFDGKTHDRSAFDSGHERLNNYLKTSATKLQKGDFTRIYVAVLPGQSEVLGYHAINFGELDARALEKVPRGAPAHMQLPVLFLGQIAVTKGAMGVGLGGILMHHVFEKAVQLADQAGCWAIILDAVDDDGEAAFQKRISWYEAFGFRRMPSKTCRMFMTLKDVRGVVETRKAAE
ncbi:MULTISPECIES: GNAT family N-acetyltransferase [unclassified Ruegeria]|uniref:GNAT family N-acetyltransferase n=1 Tax=unclassified Ruegeria TaxID=2625375 RepID=UPI0014880BC8|nr:MULTISPECIES: GNAT family N-acetyltransferase [unclassified Ruegeria]